jgi:hypothetical protein
MPFAAGVRHGATVTLTYEQVVLEVIEGDIGKSDFVSVEKGALEVIRRSMSPYGKAKDDQNRSIVATFPACGSRMRC